MCISLLALEKIVANKFWISELVPIGWWSIVLGISNNDIQKAIEAIPGITMPNRYQDSAFAQPFAFGA